MLRVQSSLTLRDHTVLAWLGDHGVLTTHQVAEALFPSPDFAQRRLRALREYGLIDRFRPLKLDGGSCPYHWVLNHLGALVLTAQRGQDAPRPAQTRARIHALTHRSHLAHLLGANQFFTDLAGYARSHPTAGLVRWWPTARCGELGVFAASATDYRQFGYRAIIRPDGHGAFTDRSSADPETRTVPFFLEHDTGTEPLSTLVGKVAGYRHLSEHTGHRWPLLFWLHSAMRERHLHRELDDLQPGPIFPIATAARDRIADRNPAEAIWWLHSATGPFRRLADLPATRLGPDINPDPTYGSLPNDWNPQRPDLLDYARRQRRRRRP